jgi:hypothetical protein
MASLIWINPREPACRQTAFGGIAGRALQTVAAIDALLHASVGIYTVRSKAA